MSEILVVRKYNFDLDITATSFKEVFIRNLTNENLFGGKDLKGKIDSESFSIIARERFRNTSNTYDFKFTPFFELDGNFNESNNKLKINLKLRIKKRLQAFWLIGYILLAYYLFFKTQDFLFVIPVILFIAVFLFVIMKIGISQSESFFLGTFSNIYNMQSENS